MAGALNTNSSGLLTKQATVSQGSTHFRDIARAWFHLASCQSYNIWDSLPLCQAESRGSEVKPLAKDTQPAEGKTRIRIQEVLQPCPSFWVNLCIWDQGVAETLPSNNSSFLPSHFSSVYLSLSMSSSPGLPHYGPNYRSPGSTNLVMGQFSLQLPLSLLMEVWSLIRKLPGPWRPL